MKDRDFQAGNISTAFIAEFLAARPAAVDPPPELDLAVALAVAADAKRRNQRPGREASRESRWMSEGRGQLLR
jgi:hypothetical protein